MNVKLGLLRLKKVHTLKALENGVLRAVGREKGEMTQGWRKVHNEFFMICFLTKQY
jgi:hypothetical protein